MEKRAQAAVSRQEWLEAAEQRSAGTRRHILATAVELIADLGFSRFSTTELAARASVTRGAIQHHFGNRKIDLILAVAEYIYERFRENAAEVVPTSGSADEIIVKMIESARTVYEGPESTVLIELWMAARSDPTLKDALVPVLAKLDAAVGSRWSGVLRTSAASPETIETMRYVGRFVMRGMALERQLWRDPEQEDRVVGLLKELFVARLSGKQQ